MCLVLKENTFGWGEKHFFGKAQGTTSGKLASYIQMNVCKILARSVKPRHERTDDELNL